MGLLNKLKNVIFEEEEIEVPVEETPKKVKKAEAEKKPVEKKRNVYETEIKDDTPIVSDSELFKAEKTFDFPVFDDQEFENMKTVTQEEEIPKSMGINLFDYEKPKVKKERKERVSAVKGRAYDTKTTEQMATRKFKPSPVISPVYGVLDKNYHKEDVIVAKAEKKEIDVDDVRKKAFGTLEEDIEKNFEIPKKNKVVEEEKTIDELLEETSFDAIEVPESEIIESEPITLDVLDKEKEKSEKEILEDDTLENDLFDLIDSMYEDKEEE